MVIESFDLVYLGVVKVELGGFEYGLKARWRCAKCGVFTVAWLGLSGAAGSESYSGIKGQRDS